MDSAMPTIDRLTTALSDRYRLERELALRGLRFTDGPAPTRKR
jgi:hypothetical protein